MSLRALLIALSSLILGINAVYAQPESSQASRTLPPAGGEFALHYAPGNDAAAWLHQLQAAAALPLQMSPASRKGVATDDDSLVASAFEVVGRPRALAGLQHQRYQQTLHGLPVLGAEVVMHTKAAQLLSANGRFYRAQVLASEPTFSAVSAEGVARAAHRHAQTVTPQGRTRRHARATVSAPTLVYADLAYPKYTGYLALAWQIVVATPGTPDGRAYLLDATDGHVLHEMPTVAHGTVPGSIPTNYYGRQIVPVTATPAGFELRDDERGITVTQENNGTRVDGQLSSATSSFDVSDERFGRMAFDIYYAADRMYDLLFARYAWRGIDGDGEDYKGVADDVPYSPYVNAYWDGTSATFGQGDCHYGPLTTLDVVGHEFTHGVTERTSDLIYDGESGALNEALSDILGKSLERLVAPEQFTWELGNRFADSPYAEGFRSMADPTLFNNPKEVDGPLWRDDADVHFNSGPLGYWYYLLVEGGSGTTSTDLSFAVTPLGLDEALNHAFALNTGYLTSTSTYADAYRASLLLAADTYGPTSASYVSITQAWRAIGLPQAGNPGTTGDDLELVVVDFDDFCAGAEETNLFIVYRYSGEPRPENTPITVELRALPSQQLVATQMFTPIDGISGDGYAFRDLTISTVGLLPLPEEGFSVTLLLNGDTKLDNNTAEANLDLFPAGLLLAIESAEPAFQPCYGENIAFEINFTNGGCQPLAGPVKLTFADRAGNTLGTSTLRLDGLRAGDYGMREYVELNETWASRVALVTATTPGDRADDDNSAELLNEPELILPTGLTLTASDASDEAYVQIWNPRFILGSVARINTLNRGAAWVSTGEGRVVYEAPCADPAFAAASGFTSPPALLVCIDNGSGEASTLEFDASALVGKPSANFGELDGYRNTLSIRYGEADLPAQFYQSPNSEAVARVSAPIPAGYRGPVMLELSNATGVSDWSSSDAELRDYDYWVIDNISLRVASSVSEVGGSLRLSPNPTRSGFELSLPPGGAGDLATLRVYDALGRVRHNEQVSPAAARTHVNTGDWIPGLYTVSVEYPGGARAVARVVVQ